MKSPESAVTDPEAATATDGSFHPLRVAVLVGLLALAAIRGGWSLLLVIVAVLVIVFVHELGHFVTARMAGMKVTEFFFGFGPRIASFRRGEVEYGIKAIPAGAYVRIVGMTSVDEVAPADEERTYRRKPYRWRVLVAAAGVITHAVMALVLVWAVLVFHGREDSTRWTIREVVPGSAAAAAGAQRGDRLVSLGGQEVPTFADMTSVAELHREQEVPVVLERDGVTIESAVTLEAKASVWGTVGEDLDVASTGSEVTIISVAPRSRAAEAGIRSGDRVVGLNGVAVSDLDGFRRGVEAADGGRLDLSVSTDGAAPRAVGLDLGRAVALSPAKGFFGVGQQPAVERMGVVAAVPATFRQVGHLIVQIGGGLGKVFSLSGITHTFERATTAPSQVGPDEPEPAATTLDNEGDRISSIVGAVNAGSSLFEDGWVSAFAFLIFLNLTLGLLNLIPLPPFDGGHIMVASYEKVRELFRRRRGQLAERYLVDANKLVPVAILVIGVFAVIGLVAMYLDLAQPVRV